MGSSSRGTLRHVVDRNRLIDLGYSSYAYTWNRGRGKPTFKKGWTEALLMNIDICFFLKASILCLTTSHSDHMPIMLSSHPSNPSRPKPFHFEGMWVCDLSVDVVVKEA